MCWGLNDVGETNSPIENNFVAISAGCYHSLALRAANCPSVHTGDLNHDCKVDFGDLAVFADQWLLEKLSADVAPNGGDGIVNFLDWTVFANNWQGDMNSLADFSSQWLMRSAYSADIAPAPSGDGFVNMLDFALFAEHWLQGQ